MLLTDIFIRNSSPRAKPYKLPRERGPFVLINPGGAKSFRLAYTFRGREKLLSMGRYPAVSLAVARKRRDEAHELLAAGVDPSVRRQAEKAREEQTGYNTFRAIAGQCLTMRVDSSSAGANSQDPPDAGACFPQHY